MRTRSRVGVGVVGQGDPDARPDRQPASVEVDGFREAFDDVVGDGSCTVAVPWITQQDCELVASEPGREVVRAHAVRDPLGQRDEHGVTRDVPEPVVDGLEVVDVDEEQGVAGGDPDPELAARP